MGALPGMYPLPDISRGARRLIPALLSLEAPRRRPIPFAVTTGKHSFHYLSIHPPSSLPSFACILFVRSLCKATRFPAGSRTMAATVPRNFKLLAELEKGEKGLTNSMLTSRSTADADRKKLTVGGVQPTALAV